MYVHSEQPEMRSSKRVKGGRARAGDALVRDSQGPDLLSDSGSSFK